MMTNSIGSGGGAAGHLQSLFKKADTDGDAALSRDELISSFAQMTGGDSDASSSMADQLLSDLDSDAGGSLSGTEFGALAGRFGGGGSQALLSAQEESGRFNKMASDLMSQLDEDGDGAMSSDELSSALTGTEVFTDEQISSAFSDMDADGDGAVSETEMAEALAAGAPPPPPPGPPPAEGAAESRSSDSSQTTTTSQTAATSSSGEASSSDEEYDDLDTNRDGVVSYQERVAGMGVDQQTSTSALSSRLGASVVSFMLQNFNEMAA
jgi:Ca2+-binding EF-hand superfamily protein